jgi:hypothetical protein
MDELQVANSGAFARFRHAHGQVRTESRYRITTHTVHYCVCHDKTIIPGHQERSPHAANPGDLVQ